MAQSYTFKQTTAAAIWSIQHNLQYNPQVTVFTLDIPPKEILGRVRHTSITHLDIYFDAPTKAAVQFTPPLKISLPMAHRSRRGPSPSIEKPRSLGN